MGEWILRGIYSGGSFLHSFLANRQLADVNVAAPEDVLTAAT